MTPALYRRLVERARGGCECGCGAGVPPGEIDHAFGRARANDSEDSCWVLTPRCHYAKSSNSPDASVWLRKFITHCERHGYVESAKRARARLDFVDTRRALGSALGRR